MNCVVYWLFDSTCSNPETDGYVGITNNAKRRISQHKQSKKFPDFKMKILFEGSEAECLSLEMKLRNDHSIGWNVVPGGGKPPVCRKMSEETKRKISQTRLAKKIRLSEESIRKMSETKRAKKEPAWNRGLKVTDEVWLRNLSTSHKGNKQSEETKTKISRSTMGKPKPWLRKENRNG